MDLIKARRVLVNAFTKKADEATKTTVPATKNTSVPAIAGTVRGPGRPRVIENAPPARGPTKGMVPQLNLSTNAPRRLNVSASAINEALEKMSAGAVPPAQPAQPAPAAAPKTPAVPKPPAPKPTATPKGPPGGLAAMPKMTPAKAAPATPPKVTTASVRNVLNKIGGIHDVTRDTKSKETQKPTKPGVEKLESASDEKPKKAPEKKPEPKTSENETAKEAAGRAMVGSTKKFREGWSRIFGGKAKPKPTPKPRRKFQSPKVTRRQARPSGPATRVGTADPTLQTIAGAPVPEAVLQAAAAPGGAAQWWGGLTPWQKAKYGGGAAAGVLGGGYGLSKLLEGGAAPTTMASPEVAQIMNARAAGGSGFGDLGQFGGFLGDVGSTGMSGLGDLLGGMGWEGARSTLGKWSDDPTISKLVGGGGLTLGTLLAIALIQRLLGGGGGD